MDEFIGQIVKFLSSTVIVRVMSYPSFSIEIFLAIIVCVVHLLLIFEVNTLVRRTNAKAAERLRMRHPIKEVESCSYHSIVTLQTTAVFQKKPESFQKPQCYGPLNNKRLTRRFSGNPNFGWLPSRGDSILKHSFNDRVEHLLSISPSEYVRRDKERKSREAGLRSCIQSLTSLLEKALNNDSLEIQNMSKETIKKSINTIRDNFESQILRDNNSYQLTDFPSPSLQSLIAHSTAKNALKNSLSPNLMSSIYHASNLRFSRSNFDNRANRKRDNEKSRGDSGESLSLKTSESLSEIFRKNPKEFYGEGNSRGVITS